MSALKIIIPAILVVLILAVACLVYAYVGAVDVGDRVVSVIIEPGDSFSSVAECLLAEGVVHSRRMLYYAARWRGVERSLTPGRYDFSGRNSCHSVLDRLALADFVRIRVTVYEGAPIWKTASILSEQMEIDSAEVIVLNHDSAFLESLDLPCLEGYLFPQTYFFPWGTPLHDVIREMVAMFRTQTDEVWLQEIPNGLTREDVIVLASIVEAEAGTDDEKPIIASVYHNRLKKRMRLDADPTVIYGLGGLDRPLMKKDLRRITPYNTYRMRGLPPTPINSPGLAAIRAALYPDSSAYYYFVANGNGQHRFSRTNAEHNRARYEIRRALKVQQGK